MTENAVTLLYRGIIQHLAGNEEKSKDYILQANNMDRRICTCGGLTVSCRYGKKYSRLCTHCGLIWRRGEAIKKCNARTRRPA